MEQVNDVDQTVETQGQATREVAMPSQLLVNANILMNLSHNEGYKQYKVLGQIFEVPAKYEPPIILIGKGAYGLVCSAMNSETNEKVAIKKIKNVFRHEMHAKRTLREIKLLRHLKNENIIKIKDISIPPQRDSFEDVYIAYELMDTDLHVLSRSDIQLSEAHYQFFLYQLLRGLKYIHSANVAHRDLKPSNILINSLCDLKICDFGLSRSISDTHSMSEYVVTRWYRAPEIILNSYVYNTSIDVWSVGCIFMEMVNREPLFPGNDNAHQLRLLMQLVGSPTEDDLGSFNENAKRYLRQLPRRPRQSFSEKFPNVNPSALDLMEKMLTFDPTKRISAEKALDHPYLSSFHNHTDEPECDLAIDFDYEEHHLSVEQYRELIYCEALEFNSESDK